MYCGQKLADTVRSIPEARTQSFTPNATGELSGVSDDDDHIAPEPAPKEVGGYKLVRLLGAGGMGTVYEAESPGTGRRVAVKLLSSRLASNPASVERFRQEGRLASQLTHPRCVFVLAADTDNGRPYIVMELMPGRTLKDIVDERGTLSPEEAIAYTIDLIDGLAEAHRVGMIHRDVKPSNCFLTADNRIKVGDFGLSKSLAGSRENHLTQTGAFLGTVLFASPEQIRGETLDYSSDIYSVAATLYFLLSGQAPFHHENAATALARAISEPPPRVRNTRPDVSAKLERIILKGLERDRARRWQTLDEIREALAELLPAQHAPARPRVMIAAYTLDRILLGVLIFPLELIRRGMSGTGAGPIDVFEVRWLAVSILFTYFALAEGLFGTTPGKWLFGLQVTRVGHSGPPGVVRALVRTVVFHAMLACFFLIPEWLIGLLGTSGSGAVRGVSYGAGMLCLCVQLRKANRFRGLHDFASDLHVTHKPFRVRKLRLAIHQPTPLETLLPPTTEPLPTAIGGYGVRGRLTEEPNGEQVWLAEDRALGRTVLLWLRPWGSSPLGHDPARLTRLRRLGTGNVAWNNAAYDWTAYAAPLGGPLAEAIRPESPLPWAEARHLIEQLVEEYRAATQDDSVPPRLALDHIWVEKNGRVQVLDFPLCRTRFTPRSPLLVLREATSLMIEGQPRANDRPIAAPLPESALEALNAYFTAELTPTEIQQKLADTHSHPPEVTSAIRTAHLGIQAPLLFLPLVLMFVIAFALSVGLTFSAKIRAEQAKRAAAMYDEPSLRVSLASESAALSNAINNPQTAIRLQELVSRTQQRADIHYANMFTTHRLMLEQVEESTANEPNRVAGYPKEVRAAIVWAGAPENSPASQTLSPWETSLSQFVIPFVAVFVGLVVFAGVFRGGVSMLLAGVRIVRADGRLATRRQCALRAAVVWFPFTALLLTSSLLQAYAPHMPYFAAALWLFAVVLLPVYAVIALRDPTRPPQDRIAGTYLVPA
jgi:hypothetical protein